MCWSAPASLALGATGLAVAGAAHVKGESKYITVPLAYFSIMELIQWVSYWYIGQCSLESNTFLTQLSYAHIVFQPIFMNMFLMYSVPPLSMRMKRIVYAVCAASSIALFVKIIPTGIANLCTSGTLCGPQWCTVEGGWHLAWSIPQYIYPLPGDAFMFYYFPAVFLLPLLYRAWSGALILFLSGPVLAYLLTSGNPQEWPAVWCFYSIPMIIITLVGQVGGRKYKLFWTKGLVR